MIGSVLILGLFLAGADGPRGAADATAADRITLRDGSVVSGLVTSTTSSPRGSVEFLVRRDWAEKHVRDHLAHWERSSVAATRRAVEQRRQRLADWRRDRANRAGPDDRIVAWIDRELDRLANPNDAARALLVRVWLPRSEVRELDRRPAAVERLLRLAWLSGLPDPEAMSLDDLKGALEARGYAVDAAGRGQSASLDRLLPPSPEPELTWRARRAATEVAVDSGMRFLRFQDMVIPDAPPGQQPLNNMARTTAVSELKRLLDPGQGPGRPDPLAEKLQSVADRGRIGAVVTRLVMAPDLSGVTVESTLWIREAAGRWVPFGSRRATVRPEDLKPEEGQGIAEDPQVQGAFRLVEGLGLGTVPAELKQRSLRIGAATQRAIDLARSAFNQDLDALALPVLEPAGNPAARAVPQADRKAVRPDPTPKRPRRSVLGPPDR
jgi:hypothetical protein